MDYSYLIGVFSNFSMSVLAWFFTLTFIALVLVGLSMWITYHSSKGLKKAAYNLAFLISMLFIGGVIGLVFTSLLHFITFAFVTEFKNDYS